MKRINGKLFGLNLSSLRNNQRKNQWHKTNYRAPTKPSNFADPTPRFPTLRGEKVRSLSEKYIADYLYTHSLDYQYERAITLDNYTIKPDFWLPTYNIFIEFWGMLDGDNPQYWKSFEWKTEKYQEYGIKFIPLRSADLPDLANVFPIKLKQAIGKFCTKCGTPTTVDDAFCRKCGNKF